MSTDSNDSEFNPTTEDPDHEQRNRTHRSDSYPATLPTTGGRKPVATRAMRHETAAFPKRPKELNDTQERLSTPDRSEREDPIQLDLRFAFKLKEDAEIYVGADYMAESRFTVRFATHVAGEHLYYVACG